MIVPDGDIRLVYTIQTSRIVWSVSKKKLEVSGKCLKGLVGRLPSEDPKTVGRP